MKHHEDSEQRAVIQWADMTRIPLPYMQDHGRFVGDYLFAIPNGGARNRIEAARLVGLGVRAGTPDLLFAFPVGACHGLFIEMKKRKDQFRSPGAALAALTDNQNLMMMRFMEKGYACALCYGFDAARNALTNYMESRVSEKKFEPGKPLC